MQRSTPYRPPLPRRPQATNGTPGRCPFLGTAADPGTSLAFPSDANQCYSTRLQVPISTIHQENYCLSAGYESCPVYRQHGSATGSETLVPLAAVGLASAVPDEDDAPYAVAEFGATGAAAAGRAVSPPGFPWQEQAHPDFQADIDAATARRDGRRTGRRPLLVLLLLLALIPLAWWLWTNVRPGSRGGGEATGGAIVTLPTLMATNAAGSGAAVAEAGASATPAAEGGVGQPTVETAAEIAPTIAATATPTELESIAATATALFVGATAVTECAAPPWWVPYTVEAGDTIDALAVARGIRPEELIVANCLAGPELETGRVLRLPPVGVIVAAPGQATQTVAATALPTRGPVLPTRAPILFPTPTFPVVIIIPTAAPTTAPTDEPSTRPPTRPPTQPTATPRPPTATIPGTLPTATPPVVGTIEPTQTPPIGATQTPPGIGPTVTPTPTGVSGGVTQTPPAP